jgi:starch synthase
MGLTALESMSCATPVVVSDVGALPEFVEHGVTGLIASSDEALREAMISMCTERGTSITMGLAARERIVDSYSMEVVASRVGHIYREVLVGYATSSL